MDTLATDVCVPVSRLAECVSETVKDIETHGLVAPIVGHVGDGNFHTSPVFDPNDANEKRKVEEFLGRLSERAIAMEGTCTGEHGVGQGKRKYLKAEHGHGLDVMRQIKTTLDPQNLLNPGKILPL
jgi:D-lactate dehydrogenase (cytochrome)